MNHFFTLQSSCSSGQVNTGWSSRWRVFIVWLGVLRVHSHELLHALLDLILGSFRFSSLDLDSTRYLSRWSPGPRRLSAQGRACGSSRCSATFARLMDKVLTGVLHLQSLVYLVDILVHGSSFEDALDSLQLVLSRIRAAGLIYTQTNVTSCRERCILWDTEWEGRASAPWRRRYRLWLSGTTPSTRHSWRASWLGFVQAGRLLQLGV